MAVTGINNYVSQMSLEEHVKWDKKRNRTYMPVKLVQINYRYLETEDK